MKTVAIMYSGGMDSFIAYHYAIKKGLKPICIYVNFGHDYFEKELKAMQDIGIHYIRFDVPVLDHIKIKNQIIPNRNVLLAVIGSMFSERVWIAALDGEQLGKERDKSPTFFKLISQLLTYTSNFFRPKTIVESPFSNKTKSEIIRWALDNGIPAQNIMDSSSCYSKKYQKCGTCLTCVKRYLALSYNGIHEICHKDPKDSEYYKELVSEIKKADQKKDYSRFNKKRIKEFLNHL